MGFLSFDFGATIMDEISTYFCERPVIIKTVWDEDNADQKFKRCATQDYAFDIWVYGRLGPRACEAIHELQREITKLHTNYRRKIENMWRWEFTKRKAITAKLKKVMEEVDRDKPYFN